jgi:hypothetical protein
MANDTHINKLMEGVAAWNAWRKKNPHIRPDLQGELLRKVNSAAYQHYLEELLEPPVSPMPLKAFGPAADLCHADLSNPNLSHSDLSEARLIAADLCDADLGHADLSHADLGEARLTTSDLRGANLIGAHLLKAKLGGANLNAANLIEADLHTANLSGAILIAANLRHTKLNKADLSGANLEAAILIDTDLRGADLTGCRIYGISAWGLKIDGETKQQNLVITPANEPEITVDNIEVAQFIYLMLHNQKIRAVIETITSRAVLILGRFTPERKAVLDALRDELRRRNYLPILFDFDVPATRDITETVSLLARMARFVIADLTDPSSIPKELEAIVPHLAVPVQPLLEGASRPYSMFKDYWKYDWVLPLCRYEGLEQLLATIKQKVIEPAEAKVDALKERRRITEAELLKSQVP